MADLYTMRYGDFMGVDATGDPRTVERNRLAYLVNMWRDYESEQGAAIETFPGFRRVAHSLGKDASGGAIGAVHGLYHFRTRRGHDLIVCHAGTKLYSFPVEELAAGAFEDIESRSAILSEGVSDADSTGFIFNNNLYLLDGEHYLRVSDVGEESVRIEASAVDAYVPTTYYNGNMYEQRNMLSTKAYQAETGGGNKTEDGKAIAYGEIYNTATESITGANLTRGFADAWFSPKVVIRDYGEKFQENPRIIRADIDLTKSVNQPYDVFSATFLNCKNLKVVYIKNSSSGSTYVDPVEIGTSTFEGCESLTDIYIGESQDHVQIGTNAIPAGCTVHYNVTEFPEDFGLATFDTYISVIDLAFAVESVTIGGEELIDYLVHFNEVELGGEMKRVVDRVYFNGKAIKDKEVKIELSLYPAHIQVTAGMNSFLDGNPGYKKTTVEAISACTKSAVFDGRIFLTGNGELPNTVFYSHRNLTGANDPAYFGIYNYFNDGVGNTPNVDLLSTPSFLMVLKGDTVQDGSVYYHTGLDNTDEFSADLLPRIYPSTQGASGLGSAGKPVPSRLSCNFLDDPVFLSKRGLEGVSKQTVNLERTIMHRSGNVDRLLMREDLSRATMAEWKGYLAICCDGNIYLADSRYFVQHPDGSYQYEWYYLEGLGTYERYESVWRYIVGGWPLISRDGAEDETLDRFVTKEGKTVGELYELRPSEGKLPSAEAVNTVPVYHPDDESVIVDLYYTVEEGRSFIVGITDGEQYGRGAFFGADKLLAVGDRLIFGTENGDVCVINTDMRGVSVDGRDVIYNQIDRSFYSFNGVAYRSGCSFRLDDCGKKSVTKNTECGTTAIRFKTMPGSRAWINITLNGRDWSRVETFNSRFDFADIQFSNFSFTENEDNVMILPELTRGWVNKQYYIYNDVYENPFGIYELSYMYYVYGKIRY